MCLSGSLMHYLKKRAQDTNSSSAQNIPSDSTFSGLVRRTSLSGKTVCTGCDLCGPVLDGDSCCDDDHRSDDRTAPSGRCGRLYYGIDTHCCKNPEPRLRGCATKHGCFSTCQFQCESACEQGIHVEIRQVLISGTNAVICGPCRG